MKTNVKKTFRAETYEGGRADPHQKPLEELRRAVTTCLLFEDTFYESGKVIAKRLQSLCHAITPAELAALAVEARYDFKLRHVPLLLARELVRHPGRKADPSLVGKTLAKVINRPDEIAEFLALYWMDNNQQPLSKQVKLGLAEAFRKFDAYQLAKWNVGGTVKLRDALFLSHAKPVDAAGTYKSQGKTDEAALRPGERLFYQLANGTLPTPDTWEVAITAAGEHKKEAWERLLTERKLGYMALLQNLRNMLQAQVDVPLIETALRRGAEKSWALPFRFVSAAKHAPALAQALSDAMVLSLKKTSIDGDTLLIIDVSGSMDVPISMKSTLNRWEAAAALGVLFREAAPACRVFTFSSQLVEVPNLKGLALIEAVKTSQPHHSTYLARALTELQRFVLAPHRIVVITDEQAHDGIIPGWGRHNYLVNVAPYKPALDTLRKWTRISGWSERLVDWMNVDEGSKALGGGDD